MPRLRRIAVLTTGRQDFGILRSTVIALRDAPDFDTLLWAGGMHLSPRFGRTIDRILADGFPVHRQLDFLVDPPDPAADAARALAMVAEALDADRPDALLLVGDRSETMAAGVAATISRVPLVHLHGGEETEGAIDNAFRHALTKLSHLHLVSHPRHAARVLQMGEDPATVVVVGAPGLDNLYRDDLPSRVELETDLGSRLGPPVVVVTLHAATLGGDPLEEVSAVAQALDAVPATYIITQPNADAGGSAIRTFWLEWASGRDHVTVVDALGERRYWGLLRLADAMVSNSSSGLIEAPAAGVPVVNVGDRQKGRLRSPHVADVTPAADVVAEALRSALDPATRRRLADEPHLYPGGPAAPRILAALRGWRPPVPPRKVFHHLSPQS